VQESRKIHAGGERPLDRPGSPERGADPPQAARREVPGRNAKDSFRPDPVARGLRADPLMSLGRICTRTVSIASPEESVAVAAGRMAEHGVDADATPIGDVMSTPVATVHESTPIEDGLARMAAVPARRLVVTDDRGGLVGVLALDDVLDLIAEEAGAIGRLLRR